MFSLTRRSTILVAHSFDCMCVRSHTPVHDSYRRSFMMECVSLRLDFMIASTVNLPEHMQRVRSVATLGRKPIAVDVGRQSSSTNHLPRGAVLLNHALFFAQICLYHLIVSFHVRETVDVRWRGKLTEMSVASLTLRTHLIVSLDFVSACGRKHGCAVYVQGNRDLRK